MPTIDKTPPGYETLQRAVLAAVGIDLDLYRSRQLMRRLVSFARQVDAPDLSALARRIAREPELQEHFRRFFSINFTEFFRNPEKWRQLQTIVLPLIRPVDRSLSAWSAGCSHGQEPYTLAMLLHDFAPGVNHYIWATDIDEEALAAAKAGIYNKSEVQNIPADWLAKYFTELDDLRLQVKPTLQAGIRFQRHDMLIDPLPADKFDLIVCRNVIIYFTDSARSDLFRRFVTVLNHPGALFIGGTETLFDADQFGLEPIAPGFYMTKAVARKGALRHVPHSSSR